MIEFINDMESNVVKDQFDIKMLLRKALSYWYLYVLGFPLIVLLGLYYLASTPKVYEASALLLIKDQKESGQIGSLEYINLAFSRDYTPAPVQTDQFPAIETNRTD